MTAGTSVQEVGAVQWRALSFRETLREAKHSKPAQILLLVWGLATLVCVALGIMQVNAEWNGLPIQLGPIHFSVTIYPPLVVCVWMVFWLGFEWAFLAAYLATFTLAIYSQMAPISALLFALVDPLALAVYALAYRTARISFDLRHPKSGSWFIVVSFVAAVAGSTGSFIWSAAHGLSAVDTLAIWQGWWIGAWIQAVVMFWSGSVRLAEPVGVLAAIAEQGLGHREGVHHGSAFVVAHLCSMPKSLLMPSQMA